MPNRVKWTIVHYKPPEAMTLNGDGVGGVKVKLIAKVTPKDRRVSDVSFDVHLGGPALFGPIGMIVAAALRSDIRESLQNFVKVFSGPDPGMNGNRGIIVDHSRTLHRHERGAREEVRGGGYIAAAGYSRKAGWGRSDLAVKAYIGTADEFSVWRQSISVKPAEGSPTPRGGRCAHS